MMFYSGTWSSSVVAHSVAHGRLFATIDGNTALFTLVYEGAVSEAFELDRVC